ncbi:MAG: hypothetical protein ACKO86_14540, partial [Dolichospermum sp.]
FVVFGYRQVYFFLLIDLLLGISEMVLSRPGAKARRRRKIELLLVAFKRLLLLGRGCILQRICWSMNHGFCFAQRRKVRKAQRKKVIKVWFKSPKTAVIINSNNKYRLCRDRISFYPYINNV